MDDFCSKCGTELDIIALSKDGEWSSLWICKSGEHFYHKIEGDAMGGGIDDMRLISKETFEAKIKSGDYRKLI
jgi:hypothetical protein